ncbi:RING finger protein 37-like [Lineus longissimus]|uniref:RING finger protein 37-like n=1 Tax=Lineus longissimus TaxID=88925 RepID=UPI00315D44F4
MAWDFCSPYLKPRIFCDKVSVDGHEITNIISDNYLVKNNGFLAERFIKPPVMMTIAFPCNIYIQKIVINPIVGSQKSCGFEIMTRSDLVKDSWIVNDNFLMEQAPHTQGMFVTVGRCLREYTGPTVFVFSNPSYCRHSGMSQNTHQYIDCAGQNVINSEIRHFRNTSLACVSHVLIRITRTQGGCIPCVKSIAVFGQPAHSVPKPILDKIWGLHNDFIRGQQQVEVDVITSISESGVRVTDSDSVKKEDEIPNEFMDPITCDIMTMPLLLPSGHSIDKNTMERHIAEEAKWGRSPNDPFTGVAFHGASMPIPNSSLKVRIDHFLVRSGKKFENVARTIGHSMDFLNRDVALNTVYDTAPKVSEQSSDSDCEIIEVPAEASFQSVSVSLTKSHSSQNVLLKRKGYNLDKSSPGPGDKKRKTKHVTGELTSTEVRSRDAPSHMNLPATACHKLPFATAITFTSKTKGIVHASHENNLSHSLDSAVSLTLGNLPSFRKPAQSNETTDTKKTNTTCMMCHLNLKSSKVAAYLLPCSHNLCRNCLLSVTKLSNEVVCKRCLMTCPSKDIKKIYVT